MAEVFDWSIVDASNNATPPVGAPEGMAPSTVNDILRAMMGSIRREQGDTGGSLVTTGTSSAYALTPNRVLGSLFNGLKFVFRPHVTNDVGATLRVSSLPISPLLKASGAAVAAGDLTANTVVEVYYSTALSAWIVPNISISPQAVTTLTGANQSASLGFSPSEQGLELVGSLNVSGATASPVAVTTSDSNLLITPGTHANRLVVFTGTGAGVFTMDAQPSPPNRLWKVGDGIKFAARTHNSLTVSTSGSGVNVFTGGVGGQSVIQVGSGTVLSLRVINVAGAQIDMADE